MPDGRLAAGVLEEVDVELTDPEINVETVVIPNFFPDRYISQAPNSVSSIFSQFIIH